jgi:hypothetical protein
MSYPDFTNHFSQIDTFNKVFLDKTGRRATRLSLGVPKSIKDSVANAAQLEYLLNDGRSGSVLVAFEYDSKTAKVTFLNSHGTRVSLPKSFNTLMHTGSQSFRNIDQIIEIFHYIVEFHPDLSSCRDIPLSAIPVCVVDPDWDY